MIKLTRRRLLTATLSTAAGVAGAATAVQFANSRGFIAPNYGGILGPGEVLTYGAQRALMSIRSYAREFRPDQISPMARVNHPHPRFDPYQRLAQRKFADWRLYVDGMVARPNAYSLADLKAMPGQTQITQLICEEGWSFIAAWTGVRMSDILARVEPHPDAKWVVLQPFDEFWGSIDMTEALHPQTLLAYGMNGSDLPLDHGAPLRLRVPRQLGYKNLKYLARISVTDRLDNIGDGNGSAAPDLGYSWYAGI